MRKLLWYGGAVLGAALAIAACGGSSKHGSTDPGLGQGLKFADCMRAHGVANFPDPGSGGGIKIGPGSGLNPQSPSFQAAQRACSKYAPLGRGFPKMSESQRRAALKFAECMRTHGEPNFPDPTLTAPKGLTAVLVLRGMVFAFPQPINPQSPAFKQAASACGVTPPGGKGP